MLKRIRMLNCQSWKDSTIELANDKVNVIAAPNNVGKSVLFKFLKITASPKYYNADDRKQLIRWGCQMAGILYEFDEGFGYVKVYPTGVTYGYAKNGEAVVESKTPNPEMLENIGLLTSDTFIANIIDTEQDLLLVNPALRANADLMQLLVYCENLDSVREKIEKIQSDLVPVKSSLVYRNNQLDNSISNTTYVDVDKLKQKLDVATMCKDLIYKTIIPVYKKIGRIDYEVKDVPDFEKLLNFVAIAEKVENIDFKKTEVVDFNVDAIKLIDILTKFDNLQIPDVSTFNTDTPKLYHILELISKIEFVDIEEFNSDTNVLYQLLEKLQKIMFVNVVSFDVNTNVLCSILERLEVKQLKDICNNLDNASKALNEKDDLNKALADKGEIYDCPIYGKVVYDGKECVSCDN